MHFLAQSDSKGIANTFNIFQLISPLIIKNFPRSNLKKVSPRNVKKCIGKLTLKFHFINFADLERTIFVRTLHVVIR